MVTREQGTWDSAALCGGGGRVGQSHLTDNTSAIPGGKAMIPGCKPPGLRRTQVWGCSRSAICGGGELGVTWGHTRDWKCEERQIHITHGCPADRHHTPELTEPPGSSQNLLLGETQKKQTEIQCPKPLLEALIQISVYILQGYVHTTHT